MTTSRYPELKPAVDGDFEYLEGRAGKLGLYTAGKGKPVLLLHSINAAGAVSEVAPIFDHLRHTHRVYAPDLPGFGFSDRSERDYNIELYVAAIEDVLDRIAQDSDDKMDAVALSLSSEFLARAAQKHSQRFRSLTLITPTGFRKGSENLRAPPGTTRYMGWLDSLLTFSLWKKPLYGALVRPGTIRYFLRRTYGSPNIDESLARYCDITTHQPDAEHAPYAFLSGGLFGKDIRSVYESLTMPVFVPHGTRGDFADFRGGQWTAQRNNWQLLPYKSGAMPHFEIRETFMQDLDKFFNDAAPT